MLRNWQNMEASRPQSPSRIRINPPCRTWSISSSKRKWTDKRPSNALIPRLCSPIFISPSTKYLRSLEKQPKLCDRPSTKHHYFSVLPFCSRCDAPITYSAPRDDMKHRGTAVYFQHSVVQSRTRSRSMARGQFCFYPYRLKRRGTHTHRADSHTKTQPSSQIRRHLNAIVRSTCGPFYRLQPPDLWDPRSGQLLFRALG